MGNLKRMQKYSAILSQVVLLVFVISFTNGQKSSGNGPEIRFDPFSTDQWFKQKLDHYDTSNVEHWPQRYVTTYRYYRLGGPIFLYLSGPGPELALRDIESGAIAGYAEEQGAFVIGLEHRYYGKSRPTKDLSTDNLQYLTVPQTIEDIAAFIRSWKARDDFRDSKWVLFGASYLGSITAWFAHKHPELIDVFVASSAPLELRYEIPDFLQNVGFILNRTDPKCYDTISTGFKCLSDIFNEEGCENYSLDDVKNKFDFCADLDPTRPLDASGAIAELFSTVNGVVMYHDPNPASFPDTNLDRFCKHISSDIGGKTALDKIAEKVREINKHRGAGCAEFRFDTTVDFLDEKGWDSDAAAEGYRQLQWQLCNELGWTVAAANISQPFGNYLSPFLHGEICHKLFGLTETEMRLKVLQANTDLHGKNISTTQCGIFVNGDMDPWNTFSITTPYEAGKCNRALLIEGGSHARDIEDFINAPSHPPTIRQTQIKIAHYIDTWLRTGRCCEEDAISRTIRAPNPKDYFELKRPNVQIRHRAYPSEVNDRYIPSPTSRPYQSSTDVLSVSPRIPVAEDESPAYSSPEGQKFNGDIYRDPRNAEFRRYRIVKMLRHRSSMSPPTEAQNPPSMEQFEADFPEYKIRVEGRVEKVYKNGTKVASTQIPSPQTVQENDQLEMFSRGRKILTQTAMPYMAVGSTPKSEIDMGENDENKDPHFRYVVKHVFKDVVDRKNISSSEESEEENGSGNLTLENSEPILKRQQSMEEQVKKTSKKSENLSSSESESSRSSSEEDHVSENRKRKRESSEKKDGTEENSDEENSDEYAEDDETAEHSASPNSKKIVNNDKSGEKSGNKTKSAGADDDEYDDDEYDDDYYDDDYDDDSKEDKIKKETLSNKISPSRSSNFSKTNNTSTEFSSGEDSKPKKLREKISEKIKSSSEVVEGDQRSKEKDELSKKKSRKGINTKRRSEDDDSLEDSRSSLSDEDYNYSMEPSGSDPQHVYSKSGKKQLAPIAKPVIEEPGKTVNVEISGSYPKRNKNRKKIRTTTTSKPDSDEDDSSSSSSEETPKTKATTTTTRRPPPTRKIPRRHRPKTTEPTETTTTPKITTSSPYDEDERRTNSYVAWNRDKELSSKIVKFQAEPIQQEAPDIVSLNSGGESDKIATNEETEEKSSEVSPKNKNDVIYIVIGDVPKETDDANVVDYNYRPSGDDLFKFIQKLVNRHSSGMYQPTPQEINIVPPSPTPIPPPSPPPTVPPTPSVMNYGFDGPTGRYLLVRPVQVVSLGRDHVVHAHDLKNESLIDLMTMETPTHPSPYHQYNYAPTYSDNMKRQYAQGYRFKSPFHRDHFEKLLSVDGQVRDSDRSGQAGYNRQSYKRLDQIPDPTWRSIRGVEQFGSVGGKSNPTSGLLSLSAADTQWVDEGVPFLPRNGRHK